MKEKINSYLGFAKKSRNMLVGYNTCVFAINRNKVKLLILTVDLSQNTLKKIMSLVNSKNIPYRVFGTKEEISSIVGTEDRGIFAITDSNFAKVISEEIDKKNGSVE